MGKWENTELDHFTSEHAFKFNLLQLQLFFGSQYNNSHLTLLAPTIFFVLMDHCK